LATTRNRTTEIQDGAPTLLPSPAGNLLVKRLVDEQFATAHTDAIQHVQNLREELDEIHRAGEFEMAEMARAGMIRLATTTTGLSVVQNAHSRVKQAANTGFIAVVRSCVCHFHDGAPLNLFRTENSELNTNNWLNIGSRSVQSCGHSSLTLVGISIGLKFSFGDEALGTRKKWPKE
jgi:hypothetical protein